MKKPISGLGALALMVAVSLGVSSAWAQNEDKPIPTPAPDFPCPGLIVENDWYTKLSPEKQKAWDASWREHQAVMQPLRDQMWRKNMEYKALSGNSNMKPEELRVLLDEMSDLRTKMRAQGEKFHDKLIKDGFDQWVIGPRGGYGHGGGHGPGDGYHYNSKGYGGHKNKYNHDRVRNNN